MKSMQQQICLLLLTFANSLDPDQAQHNFQSNLEQKMFDTQMVFLIIIFFFLKKKKLEEGNNKMKRKMRERAVFDYKQQSAAILKTELI